MATFVGLSPSATTPTVVAPGAATETKPVYVVRTPGIFPWSSQWIMIIGAVLALIILILIILFVVFLIRSTQKEFYPPVDIIVIDNVNDNSGASLNGEIQSNENGISFQDAVSCEAAPNTQWVNSNLGAKGSCQCVAPFYGPECQLESYPCNYIAVGNTPPEILNTNFSEVMEVDQLAFPLTLSVKEHPFTPGVGEQNTIYDRLCIPQCDQNENCSGVLWDGNTCQLILGDIIVESDSTIPYNPQQQSNFYIKNDTLLQFKNKVFVYKGERPLRYWSADNYRSFFGDNQLQTIYQKQLIRFNWIPTDVINTTDSWYGFFSSKPFSVSDDEMFNILVNSGSPNVILDGQEFIVISPDQTTLSLPENWKEFWGTFTPILNQVNNTEYFRMNQRESNFRETPMPGGFIDQTF